MKKFIFTIVFLSAISSQSIEVRIDPFTLYTSDGWILGGETVENTIINSNLIVSGRTTMVHLKLPTTIDTFPLSGSCYWDESNNKWYIYNAAISEWINQTGGGGGSISWGSIIGTLSNQIDLQSVLDSKSSTSHNHSGVYAPISHSHAQSDITNLVTDLAGKEPANSNIQTHVTSAHAPSNAQKNSDIIKAEIEAKLTGEISTHTHAGGGGGNDMTTIVNAMRAKPFLFTDFLGTAGAATIESHQGWDYAVISSGTQAKIAGEANHIGILRTSSSTTANSGGYCTIEATAFLIAGGETFELIFQHRVASGTATTLRFGFLDNITSSDAVDGCYFEVPAASLALVGKTANNSTRSTTATIYTLTVNTWYRAKVQVNSNATSVTFYLYNDAGTLLGSQSLTTNIPIASGRNTGAGFVATNSGTTATLLAYWDMMAVYYNDRALTR